MSKALGLMSGGLDSSLAAMTLMRQGIEVTGISFVTPFFGASKAKFAAEKIGFPLIVKEISDIHLQMVKNPKYGYGRNMNPCIDCHSMMFRLAGEIMQEQGFDFLFSGEVLGQRPMSQNANALSTVSIYSGHADKVLRPLSAKLLAITPMEESGLVDRERLLDIQGRSRKRQQELAVEWGFPEYPSSGGGCLLTESGFADRLRDLLEHDEQASVNDVQLLKVGRQFRLSDKCKMVLGRNQADNDAIHLLATGDRLRLRNADFNGPSGLLCGESNEAIIQTAAAIVASYGKGKDEPEVRVILDRNGEEQTVLVAPLNREDSIKLLV
ncbi:thiamine biosynthesis protein [Geopsychrobacter electrodiphilus]|uniref:thiamine biosynthesis protein n=1 Tax=Geopsychrobacter electrodiphilus TaxID=225196 RepID=UPI00052693E0|nr:thiamine biosynthesis protein [Geopsychrobacter electrodiphilus]